MDEARAVYRSTVKERSGLKNAARHKKNGSCANGMKNLYMTDEAINSRHGEVQEFSMKGFLKYSDFRNLRSDLQIEYINKLCDKYDVSIDCIGRYVFDLSSHELENYLLENGNLNACNPNRVRFKFGLDLLKYDAEEWKKKVIIDERIDQMEKEEHFSSFVSYEVFQQMSLEEQIGYVNLLVETYSVGLTTISTVLFKQDRHLLSNHFRKVSKRIRNCPVRGKASVGAAVKFKEIVEAWRAALPQPEIPEEIQNGIQPVEITVETLAEEVEKACARKERAVPAEADISEEESVEEPDLPVEELTVKISGNGMPVWVFNPESESVSEPEISEPEPVAEPAPVMEPVSEPETAPEAEEESRDYLDMNFNVCYERNGGIDMDQMFQIYQMVKDKRVLVKFSVTVL